MSNWLFQYGVKVAICPDCAFSFGAEHTTAEGGYSCPLCAERRLKQERDRLQDTLDAIREWGLLNLPPESEETRQWRETMERSE